MGLACLFIGLSLMALALASARITRSKRRWTPVKAHVVHCLGVAPFGRDLETPRRKPVIAAVILDDGSEEFIQVGSHPDPEVMYLAELVYFIDGAPYDATLTFESPPGETFTLLVNPANPRDYAFSEPSYSPSALLTGLGLLYVWAATF